jgi:hypothetical protein
MVHRRPSRALLAVPPVEPLMQAGCMAGEAGPAAAAASEGGLDRNGIIRFSHAGYRSGGEIGIEKEIQDLLAR